ncbi:capsid assembly scaffolding protein Gp46 family protein [Jeotgalibaca porci]|uniref:capsid assembly scaffolding protein Gp46 family protein n=1 Tax=Jeotgalibaca porci TaxID=1868793 RepID=UPI0035A182A9
MENENNVVNEQVETTASEVETENEQQTLTQEEVNRLIAQNKSKAKAQAEKEYQKQMEDLKAQYENQLTEVKSKLGDKDREAFDLQTAKAEIAKLQQALDEERNQKATLSEQITKATLKDKAIGLLSERKLPTNEAMLEMVVKDNAEDTVKAIDAMTTLLSEQRKESAISTPPITSGGLGGETQTPTEIFRNANILNK